MKVMALAGLNTYNNPVYDIIYSKSHGFELDWVIIANGCLNIWLHNFISSFFWSKIYYLHEQHEFVER